LASLFDDDDFVNPDGFVGIRRSAQANASGITATGNRVGLRELLGTVQLDTNDPISSSRIDPCVHNQ